MRWRRWPCLAAVLLAGLIPVCGLAEGGRANTPLDKASAAQRGNIELAVAALDGALVKAGGGPGSSAPEGANSEPAESAIEEDPDDAIRTDFEKGVDFRIRYRGNGSVTIYTYVLEGELICEIRHNNG